MWYQLTTLTELDDYQFSDTTFNDEGLQPKQWKRCVFSIKVNMEFTCQAMHFPVESQIILKVNNKTNLSFVS